MLSVTVKGKVCINDEINNFIGCINIEPIAIPIDTIISGKHCIEHEILKFLECLSHLCFVHNGIFAQIREHYKRLCDTLPTGSAADQFVLLSSEICVTVDVTFNVELFLLFNIVDFTRSIIHQLQQESIILQSISAGVGVTLHLVNFSTVTTIHEICANGKCLCH